MPSKAKSENGKHPMHTGLPVSARLRSFERFPSISAPRAKEIKGTLREYFKYLLRKEILREYESSGGGTFFNVEDGLSLRSFCRQNVLPLTGYLGETGTYMSMRFDLNSIYMGDIFHSSVIGKCPVLFTANTFLSQILDRGCNSQNDAGGGMHEPHSEYSGERICIFSSIQKDVAARGLRHAAPFPHEAEAPNLVSACVSLENAAYLRLMALGADRVTDRLIYDALLHEGAHMALNGAGAFTLWFGELFAFSFSLAFAKAPGAVFSLILSSYLGRCGGAEHQEAGHDFFRLLSNRKNKRPEIDNWLSGRIGGFARMDDDGLRGMGHTLIARICASHAMDLRRMQEQITAAAHNAVFGAD